MIRIVESDNRWLALGILYKAREGMQARGWEWVRGDGVPGCYMTKQHGVAVRLADELRKTIEGAT